MRLKRRRFLFRILRKRGELEPLRIRKTVGPRSDIYLFATVRNEIERLPYFIDYYRKLGIDHFFFVDNDSIDGTTDFLQTQHDVSVWRSRFSYRNSRFGVDWLGWLKFKYGHKHWCLTVDADELLVFQNSETRTLHDLSAQLEMDGIDSLGALMIDLYPSGNTNEAPVGQIANPLDHLKWFDPIGYWSQVHEIYNNSWIQGGPRARYFFNEKPKLSPTLNKIPFVRWNRRYAYVNSTHQILPIRLHQNFDLENRAQIAGALLHTKFLPQIASKSKEELSRRQHFANSEIYEDYHRALSKGVVFWNEASVQYEGFGTLVNCGLISSRDW